MGRDRQAERLIEFLNQLYTVCCRTNNRGLSYGPYKQVVAVKSMYNYSNNKLHDPHGFKEEVKIKYNAVKAVARRFPNEIVVMMALLKAEVPALMWVDFSAMPPVDQLVWEERGDELNKAMLYLMNSKNKNAKRHLPLAYSQGNTTAYPSTIKGMARYLSTQYPNNKPTHQRDGRKRGIKRSGIIQNLKTRIVTWVLL